MGLLTKKDSTIFRGFFKEMAKLRGIRVSYQYPIKSKQTIYGEPKTILSDALRIDIIFEENPKPKTLKAIGWVSEYSDDKPYVAMLPYDLEGISVDCIITLSPDELLRTRHNKFKITSMQSIMEYPDCWTCTLAPVFESEELSANYHKTNYNYVECEDQPDKEAYGKVMDGNGSYSYLSVDD